MPPAARITDMHVCPMITPGVPPIPHVGGPILPPGAPTVLIGFLPAATVSSMCVCVGPPDSIIMGSTGVLINFLPAARMGDPTAHGGSIVLGEPTVMIGEIGSPSPGAGGMGAITIGLIAAGLTSVVTSGTYSALLSTPGTQGTESAGSSEGAPTGTGSPAASGGASGDPAKESRQAGAAKVWPGQQSHDNCGIQSSGQLIAAVTGNKPDEDALLAQTVKDGNSGTTGGTNKFQRQAILASHGVPSDVVPTTRESLAAAIKANKGIIASVDAGELWNDPQYAGGGHAIMVYDGDFDANGNLTNVYINDTGTGKQGEKMTADAFMKAANAYGSFLNVTKNPVW